MRLVRLRHLLLGGRGCLGSRRPSLTLSARDDNECTGQHEHHEHPGGHRRPEPRRQPGGRLRGLGHRRGRGFWLGLSGSRRAGEGFVLLGLDQGTGRTETVCRRAGVGGLPVGLDRIIGTRPFAARSPRRRSSRLDEWRQRPSHLAGGLKALVRRLGHHLGHQGRQLHRHLRTDDVERSRLHGEMGLVQVPEVGPLERRPAGQKVVERAAQAVDVGADVGRLRVADLLGRDVIGRAQHLALAGQAAVGLAFAGDLGQAEVEHLDDALVPPPA